MNLTLHMFRGKCDVIFHLFYKQLLLFNSNSYSSTFLLLPEFEFCCLSGFSHFSQFPFLSLHFSLLFSSLGPNFVFPILNLFPQYI